MREGDEESTAQMGFSAHGKAKVAVLVCGWCLIAPTQAMETSLLSHTFPHGTNPTTSVTGSQVSQVKEIRRFAYHCFVKIILKKKFVSPCIFSLSLLLCQTPAALMGGSPAWQGSGVRELWP